MNLQTVQQSSVTVVKGQGVGRRVIRIFLLLTFLIFFLTTTTTFQASIQLSGCYLGCQYPMAHGTWHLVPIQVAALPVWPPADVQQGKQQVMGDVFGSPVSTSKSSDGNVTSWLLHGARCSINCDVCLGNKPMDGNGWKTSLFLSFGIINKLKFCFFILSPQFE